MISTTNRFFGISFGRRRTRRWMVVLYWSFVAAFFFLIVHKEATLGLKGMGALLLLQLVMNLPSVLGGVRSGGAVKPFQEIHTIPRTYRDDLVTVFRQPPSAVGNAEGQDGELDERETRLRDRMHFVSYTFSRWFALLLLGVPMGMKSFDAAPELVMRIGPSLLFLLTLVLWSLPQSLILWNEPDVEEQG